MLQKFFEMKYYPFRSLVSSIKIKFNRSFSGVNELERALHKIGAIPIIIIVNLVFTLVLTKGSSI